MFSQGRDEEEALKLRRWQRAREGKELEYSGPALQWSVTRTGKAGGRNFVWVIGSHRSSFSSGCHVTGIGEGRVWYCGRESAQQTTV